MSDLPHDRAAEHACLAAIYARGVDTLTQVLDVIREPSAMYVPLHRHLLEAMLECAEASEPITKATIASELKRAGVFDRIGGMQAIEHLDGGVITRTIDAAESVHSSHQRRRLYVALREAAEDVLCEPSISVSVGKARRVLDVLDADQASLCVPIKQAVAETRAELEAESKGDVRTVPTGYTVLDETVGELDPGDLVILGAESGMGKTALGLGVLRNGVLRRDTARGRYLPAQDFVPGLLISGEMRLPKLVLRWLSDITGIDGRQLRRDGLGLDGLESAMVMLGAVELTLTRPSQVRDLDTVGAAARSWRAAMKRRYGSGVPGIVVVDYLQLMGAPTAGADLHRNSRSDEIEGAKAKYLKRLALELGVPVIGLSQLTVPKNSEGERPNVGWLAGSRIIRHASDRVVLLHRPWIYDPNIDDLEREFQQLRSIRNEIASGTATNYNFDRTRFEHLLSDRSYAEVGLGKTRDGAAHLWLPLEFTPELTRFLDHPGSELDGGRYRQR